MSYQSPEETLDPEALKDSLSVPELIEALDDVLEWPGWRAGGVKIPTIFHEERTPSLHIYEDHWHCYSTGKGGDVIAFYQAVTGKSFRSALRDLTRLVEGLDLSDITLSRGPVQRERRTEEVDFAERVARETHHLTFEMTAQMDAKWGPRVGMIAEQRWDVRQCGEALWIPHYHGGKITGIHVRDMAGGAKFSVKGSRFTDGLYAPDGKDMRLYPVLFLTEGEPDAWVASIIAEFAHIGVAGLPNGAGVVRKEWFDEFVCARIIFFADTDPSGAGEKAAAAVIDVAPCEVTVVTAPDQALDEDGKGDLASAYRQGFTLTWADTVSLLRGEVEWL